MSDEKLPNLWIFIEGYRITGYEVEEAKGNGVEVSDHHLYIPASRIRELIENAKKYDYQGSDSLCAFCNQLRAVIEDS